MTEDFDFNNIAISEKEYIEYKDVGYKRTIEHISDGNSGDKRAKNSFGKLQSMDARDVETRMADGEIGSGSEFIASGSKYAKCKWTKEMGQYKGNDNPDLNPNFRKKLIDCEVRGTRRAGVVICRPHQDIPRPDFMFIGVTEFKSSISHGPVGWILMRDMIKLIKEHPDREKWFIPESAKGAAMYWVPFKYLSQDFSEFGE